MTILAATSCGFAVFLWRPPGWWWVRYRLGAAAIVDGSHLFLIMGVPAVLAVIPLLLGLAGPHVLLALIALAVATFAVRQARLSRRRDCVHRRRHEVVEMLGLMSAELRAGILPTRVLTGLAVDFDVLAAAARAADLGGDVPAALRDASTTPGHELLRELAGAWHVAERAGAPLAKVLARLEEASRGEREVEREVESGVAPARATGRLMAFLPVVGLLLGSGMGGDPVAMLTGTWIGVMCLAAGCALACAGVAWVERIATSAERDL